MPEGQSNCVENTRVTQMMYIHASSMELDIENEDLGFELSRSITLNKQKVGRMGRISTAWIDSMNLDLEEAYGFESDLEPIKGMLENKKTFKKIIPYPKVMRDFTFKQRESMGKSYICLLYTSPSPRDS